MKRGRPPHNDILTPREWEVLDLLRGGLTNAQIAVRLGISERGAKYHVLEILGKLGVPSRKDAARWQPEGHRSRSWSLGVFTISIEKLPLPFLVKSSAVALTAGFILGLAAYGRPSLSSLLPEADFAALMADGDPSALRAASFEPPVQRSTGTFTTVSVDSWEEAATQVDFAVLRPGHLPEGFQLQEITVSYFPGPNVQPLTTRNGIVSAHYTSSDGFVKIEQGWGMGLPHEPIPVAVPHGVTTVGSFEATWIQGRRPGGVGSPLATKPDEAYFRLGWFPDPQGASGPGWKLTTDALPLDALELIAASFE